MSVGDEMTIDEAAAELGMQPGAVRKAIFQERMAVARKVGKRINLISRAEVERYKRERRPAGRPPKDLHDQK